MCQQFVKGHFQKWENTDKNCVKYSCQALGQLLLRCLLNPSKCDKAVIKLPFTGPLPAPASSLGPLGTVGLVSDRFRAAAVVGSGARLEALAVTFNTELLEEFEVAVCPSPDQEEV